MNTRLLVHVLVDTSERLEVLAEEVIDAYRRTWLESLLKKHFLIFGLQARVSNKISSLGSVIGLWSGDFESKI